MALIYRLFLTVALAASWVATPAFTDASEAAKDRLQTGSLRNVYAQVATSVVVVFTEERRLLGDGTGMEINAKGLGSGVIVSDDGTILTASHVVNLADSVSVRLFDGSVYDVDVIMDEPLSDLAVLKMRARPAYLPVATMGDPDEMHVGDKIFAIGAPLGLHFTLTSGHISAFRSLSKFGDFWMPAEIIQTDAALNSGNSGGPLFNMRGELIGINSHIMTRNNGFIGLSFSVSINTALELLESGDEIRAGIKVHVLDADLARALNVPQEGGGLVEHVALHSIGAKLQLQAGTIPLRYKEKDILIGGDVILSVNDVPFTEGAMLAVRDAFRKGVAEGNLKLSVLRQGKRLKIKMATR